MVCTWSLGTFAWGIFNHKVLWTLKCGLWIFILLKLPNGLVLKYCYSVSNNWCISVTRCSTNWYHFPLECHVDDVIATYKKLAYWHPIIGHSDNFGSHPSFLCPKPKWKRNQDVWFTTPLVSHNQLRLIVDHLTKNCCQIKW